MNTAHGAEQDPTKQPAGRSRRASKPRKESLLVPEARGGQIAQDGFDFQRAYVRILLLKSLQDPAFTSILVDAAEDLEIRFDSQDTVERRAIQLKNYRVTAAKAREIVGQFEKLAKDSPGTWTAFVIACAELDETLKRIRYSLERYRDLRSSYPGDDPILANTCVEVGRQIDAAKLPVEFVPEQVTFEPGLQSYKEEEWVRARALDLLQEAYPGIDQATADEIYLRLYKLVSESAGRIIERQQVMTVIDAVRAGPVEIPVDFAPLPPVDQVPDPGIPPPSSRLSFERALAIDERAFGPDHPNVATAVNNLGSVLQDLGDLAGAWAAFERALRIFEKFLPPEHPYIRGVRGNLEQMA